MLGFRVRGWHIWTSGGYFIICRDVHLLRGGQVLECDRRELISDVHLVRRGHVLECRRELMLGFRVRGWKICTSGGYFIICREVRLLRGGHVLECRCDILQQQQQQQQRRQDVG